MKKWLSILTISTLASTSVASVNLVLNTNVNDSLKNIKSEVKDEKGINQVCIAEKGNAKQNIDVYINFKNLAMINELLKLKKEEQAKSDVNETLKQFPVTGSTTKDIDLFLKGISSIICENCHHLNDVNTGIGVVINGTIDDNKNVDWLGCGNQ